MIVLEMVYTTYSWESKWHCYERKIIYKNDWKLRGITKLREWCKDASSRIDKKVECL